MIDLKLKTRYPSATEALAALAAERGRILRRFFDARRVPGAMISEFMAHHWPDGWSFSWGTPWETDLDTEAEPIPDQEYDIREVRVEFQEDGSTGIEESNLAVLMRPWALEQAKKGGSR